MGFLSFKFILFLGVTFFAYFVVPKKYQWLVLLLFSYVYYFLNSRLLIAVLIADKLITDARNAEALKAAEEAFKSRS